MLKAVGCAQARKVGEGAEKVGGDVAGGGGREEEGGVILKRLNGTKTLTEHTHVARVNTEKRTMTSIYDSVIGCGLAS